MAMLHTMATLICRRHFAAAMPTATPIFAVITEYADVETLLLILYAVTIVVTPRALLSPLKSCYHEPYH